LASVVFTELLKQAATQNLNTKSNEARNWFRSKAMEIPAISAGIVINQRKEDQTNSFQPGKMYLFGYDAKNKDTLPFWDKYPLIFLLGPADGGFYGFNLHYLPYNQRAVVMDALYGIRNNKRMDESTKINMNYSFLKNASKFRYLQPALKHYLTTHMKTRFVEIPASEWEIAAFLPLQKWQNAGASTVYSNTRKQNAKRGRR
jgi:hypothetical protein